MKTWFNGGGGGGVQWRRQRSVAMAVGLRIGDDKVTMEIGISGGGWRRWASAFDSGNGRRWALEFDGGNGRQLWQRWMIDTVFNGGGGGGV